jgi:hypothetical protein
MAGRANTGTEDTGPWEELLRSRIHAQHARIERFIAPIPKDPAEWSNILREQDEIMRLTGRHALSPELRQCMYELYLTKKAAEEAAAAAAKQKEAEEEAAALVSAKKAEEEAAAAAERARIDAQHARIERFIATIPKDPAEWSNILREQDEIMRLTGRHALSPELRQCMYELYLMKKAAEEAAAAEALSKQEAEEEAAAENQAEEEAAAAAEAAAKKAVAWWEAEAAIQKAAEEAAAKHAAEVAAAAAEEAVEEEVAAKQANSPPPTRPVPGERKVARERLREVALEVRASPRQSEAESVTGRKHLVQRTSGAGLSQSGAVTACSSESQLRSNGPFAGARSETPAMLADIDDVACIDDSAFRELVGAGRASQTFGFPKQTRLFTDKDCLNQELLAETKRGEEAQLVQAAATLIQARARGMSTRRGPESSVLRTEMRATWICQPGEQEGHGAGTKREEEAGQGTSDTHTHIHTHTHTHTHTQYTKYLYARRREAAAVRIQALARGMQARARHTKRVRHTKSSGAEGVILSAGAYELQRVDEEEDVVDVIETHPAPRRQTLPVLCGGMEEKEQEHQEDVDGWQILPVPDEGVKDDQALEQELMPHGWSMWIWCWDVKEDACSGPDSAAELEDRRFATETSSTEIEDFSCEVEQRFAKLERKQRERERELQVNRARRRSAERKQQEERARRRSAEEEEEEELRALIARKVARAVVHHDKAVAAFEDGAVRGESRRANPNRYLSNPNRSLSPANPKKGSPSPSVSASRRAHADSRLLSPLAEAETFVTPLTREEHIVMTQRRLIGEFQVQNATLRQGHELLARGSWTGVLVLAGKLQASEAEAAALQQRCTALQQQIVELSARNTAFEALQTEFTTMEAEFKARNTALQAELIAVKAEVKAQRAESLQVLDAGRRTHEQFKALAIEHEQEMLKLHRLAAASREQLQKKEQCILDLQHQHQQQHQELLDEMRELAHEHALSRRKLVISKELAEVLFAGVHGLNQDLTEVLRQAAIASACDERGWLQTGPGKFVGPLTGKFVGPLAEALAASEQECERLRLELKCLSLSVGPELRGQVLHTHTHTHT